MPNPPCLDPLHPIETASVDELRSLQLKRLRHSLQHAFNNSPMYQDMFKTHASRRSELSMI